MIAQSFRYWIADKLTGGEFLRLHVKASMSEYWEKAYFGASSSRAEWAGTAVSIRRDATKYRQALIAIAAMPTPRANATVRRMARVAQEAVTP